MSVETNKEKQTSVALRGREEKVFCSFEEFSAEYYPQSTPQTDPSSEAAEFGAELALRSIEKLRGGL